MTAFERHHRLATRGQAINRASKQQPAAAVKTQAGPQATQSSPL
jgi:hypothetical protein